MLSLLKYKRLLYKGKSTSDGMRTMRTYGESCAAAHALDLVGERWALLVVRELLLGPKRFTDLHRGMAHVNPRILSQRLRELEQVGVLHRRKLDPPAACWVYELTSWGAELESVLVQLGRWGRRSPLLDVDAPVTVDAVMLALRNRFDANANHGWSATFVLRFAHDRLSVHVAGGRIRIVREDTAEPDAIVETSPETFAALVTKRQNLSAAMGSGQLTLTGDTEAVQRLFDAIPKP
jgi:DNA-binding HxlR family transcriptional regulator/putative sterol carrier protein